MLSISCKWLKGDLNAFKVLDCLSRIASLYGEQFIMLQYIKHIADLVCNVYFIINKYSVLKFILKWNKFISLIFNVYFALVA